MKANQICGASGCRVRRCPRVAGFTMIELLVVLGIAVVILGAAIPIITNTMYSMHLGSAASSLSSAIQATRYKAISVGCPYQFTILASSNQFQLATELVSGTPPACATTYTNVGLDGTVNPPPTPFANSDVTISTSTSCPNIPFLLNPSGTVSTVSTPTVASSVCIVLAHGAITKTVTVSGVGNVKVTSP